MLLKTIYWHLQRYHPQEDDNAAVGALRILIGQICESCYRDGLAAAETLGVSIRVPSSCGSGSWRVLFNAPSYIHNAEGTTTTNIGTNVDIFTLHMDRNTVVLPSKTSTPPLLHHPSAFTPLWYFVIYKHRSQATCLIHINYMDSLIKTILDENSTAQTLMLEGNNHANDQIYVSIIGNRPSVENVLADQLEGILINYPNANSVLVQRHGLIVWGDSWEQAKYHCEALKSLFDSAIRRNRTTSSTRSIFYQHDHDEIKKKEKKKSQFQQPCSIPQNLFLEHVIPFLSKRQMKKAVMKAVQTRNLIDLFFLVGHTSATVPSFLSRNVNFVKAARFSIMLPVLQRLGFRMSSSIFQAAAMQDNLEILIWLKQHDCPWDTWTFQGAAHFGNMGHMKWMRENGCPWDTWTFDASATHGNLCIMQWLLASGCPMEEWTFHYAAEHGNIVNMKWLKEKGCPWDAFTFEAAARHGNFENMKWLKENGCPWDEETFEAASENGNKFVMQWLRENGCPGPMDIVEI